MSTVYVDLIEVKPRKQRADERADEYSTYLDKFQPWRWVAKNAANHKKLARSSERYFNEVNARDAIYQLFGRNTVCYLRAAEHGNELIRHPETWPAA